MGGAGATLVSALPLPGMRAASTRRNSWEQAAAPPRNGISQAIAPAATSPTATSATAIRYQPNTARLRVRR